MNMHTNHKSSFFRRTRALRYLVGVFVLLATIAAVSTFSSAHASPPLVWCNGQLVSAASSTCPVTIPTNSKTFATCTDGSTACGIITSYDPGSYSQSQCTLYWDSTGKGYGGAICNEQGNLTYAPGAPQDPNWYASGQGGQVPSSDIYDDPFVNIGFFSGMSAYVQAAYDDGGRYSIGSGVNSMSGAINACTCANNWSQESGQSCGHETLSQSGTVDPGTPISMHNIHDCAPHGNNPGTLWGGGTVSLTLSGITECYSSLTTSGSSKYDYPPYVQHGVNYVPTAPGVCSPATANVGALTVTSEDALATSTQVAATWGFSSSSASNPCSVASCTGTYALYNNMPLGSYDINATATLANPADQQKYAFDAAGLAPIATRPSGNLFADFFSRLVNEAKAYVSCGWVNNASPNCTPGGQTQTLQNNGDTGNFTILWNPIAYIVAPSSYAMPSAYAGQSQAGIVNVTNDGGMGSTLNLTATSDQPWLTIDTPASIVATSTAGIGIHASSSLPVGTHTATITWNGTSQPGGISVPPPYPTTAISITVLPDPPSCNFGASSSSIPSGASSVLSWGCQYANSCILSGGQFGNGVATSTFGSASVTPPSTTDYGLFCSGANGTYQSTTTVTVIQPIQTPGGLREINP